MAFPILTQAQIDQLKKEKAQQEEVVKTFEAAVPAKIARAAELAVADSAFKVFFDYYNDDIIGKYDIERKALDGVFITAPITEVDITNPASVLPSRTTPALPDTDIIRIAEFDGGNTSIDTNNELQLMIDQAVIENLLQTGQTGTTAVLTGTSQTTTILSAASTSLSLTDATGPMSFSIGDEFIVHDGGSNAALVKVTSVTDDAGGDPPYDFTLGIEVVLPPIADISIGSSAISPFTGFTNGERTAKVASDPNLQPVMDSLIASLETILGNRIANLSLQISAIDSNEDDDGAAQFVIAKTRAETSDIFIDSYLLSTIISDVGITSLSTERGTRSGEVSSRVIEILANYTGQTENFYDRRYNVGNDRGSTSRGTLRLQKNAEQGSVVAQDYADAAQDQVDALDAILNA